MIHKLTTLLTWFPTFVDWMSNFSAVLTVTMVIVKIIQYIYLNTVPLTQIGKALQYNIDLQVKPNFYLINSKYFYRLLLTISCF